MHKLIQGLHHFKNEIFAEKKDLFERLAKGQRPETLFITCADSRVLPHLITQADPGDLFELRNVGNIVPAYGDGSTEGGASATIEYAISALKVKDIIICGHSHCGAMKAVLEPERLKDMPVVERWLRHADVTRRIIRENYSYLHADRQLNVATQENVLSQLETLRTHPSVAAAISRGAVRLQGWVYKIETGEVFVYDPVKEQFLAFADVQLATFKPRGNYLAQPDAPRESQTGNGKEHDAHKDAVSSTEQEIAGLPSS